MLKWTEDGGWHFSWLGALILVLGLAYILRHEVRKRRRRKSLTQGADGVYTWTEIDGTPARSAQDPRPEWNRIDNL